MSRSLPNVILPPPLEPPIRSTFESPRTPVHDGFNREKDKLEFDKFPSTFIFWQFNFWTEVCSGSYRPSDAMSWTRESEAAQKANELRTSHSLAGKHYPNFETLDAKIAAALKNILMNSNFEQKVYLEEQKAQKDNRILRGREIAHTIYEHFRVTGPMNLFWISLTL